MLYSILDKSSFFAGLLNDSFIWLEDKEFIEELEIDKKGITYYIFE